MRVVPLGVALVLLLATAGRASAGDGDRRLAEARAQFAAGRYQDAIELYARIYGERPSLCHRMPERYDEAIRSADALTVIVTPPPETVAAPVQGPASLAVGTITAVALAGRGERGGCGVEAMCITVGNK